MKHLLYTLLLGVFLTSCYRKNRFGRISHYAQNGNKQCSIPDTVVMASITRTWFYPDKKPYVNLPHAHVELYINNQYIETMQWKTLNNPRNPDQPDTLFLSNTIPAEGDRIKLLHPPRIWYGNGRRYHTKESTYKNASHTIKKVTEFIKEQFPTILKYTMKSRLMNFRKKNNYYLAKITQIKQAIGYYETEIDYIDPVFKEQDAILDESMAFNGLEKRGGALFTDQSINGQTYTLQIKETTAELDETEQRIISIYSLSESYFYTCCPYKKIAGSTLEGGLGNIGLAEPLRVYSNVGGGTGILGGNQHSETTITLNNPSKK